jgi:hypothetical protein
MSDIPPASSESNKVRHHWLFSKIFECHVRSPAQTRAHQMQFSLYFRLDRGGRPTDTIVEENRHANIFLFPKSHLRDQLRLSQNPGPHTSLFLLTPCATIELAGNPAAAFLLPENRQTAQKCAVKNQ